MPDAVHVLVVGPAAESRAKIVGSLEARSFRCQQVSTAREALDFVKSTPPDLILIDTLLPDISGLGLCRTLRESAEGTRIPIIVVSSQDSEIDRILAFEAGADDFLAAPFYPAELSARAAAVLRGFGAQADPMPPPVRQRGVLQVNRSSGTAAVRGRRLDLTPKEFEILATLAAQPGRVMRRAQLIERVWGVTAPQSDRAIDAHVKSIRRKLGEARDCIETVRGVGYRFSEL